MADWKSVALAQRGRLILDVATADLEMAEARLGAFHETTWYFRNALAEARRAWERLRAEFGSRALEAALEEPPVELLRLELPGASRPVLLVPIGGRTYRVERIPGTEIAPWIFRLTRLTEPEPEPYYVCRLHDGTAQCDCAGWTYDPDDARRPPRCKHIAAIEALEWLPDDRAGTVLGVTDQERAAAPTS